MVAPSDALFEPQPFKKIAQLAEANAGIGRAAENLRKKRFVLRHLANLSQPCVKAERRGDEPRVVFASASIALGAD